jgi:uncharacterized protein (TIGR02145 family)
VIGCVADRKGNYYVTGYFSSPTVTFGSLSLTRNVLDKRTMFLIKYDSTGRLQWSAISKGTTTQSSYATALDLGLRYDAAGKTEVVVHGTFRRYAEFGLNRSGVISRSQVYANNTDRDYYVIYDELGYPTFSVGLPPASFAMKSKRAKDSSNFSYETDTYTGTKTFNPPTITIENNGGTDVYVVRSQTGSASSDSTTASIGVTPPSITLTQDSALFSKTPLGDMSRRTLAGVLKNTGDVDVTIQSIRIVGDHAADFAVASPLQGDRIAAGASRDVQVLYVPTNAGVRKAQVEVEVDCGVRSTLQLGGTAVYPCRLDVQQVVDLKKISLNQPSPKTIPCVVKNAGAYPVEGTLRVVSASPDVQIRKSGPFTLSPGECLDLQIDIEPSTLGKKTAVIDVDVPMECGEKAITIMVDVVLPSVEIGKHRWMTKNLNVDHFRNGDTIHHARSVEDWKQCAAEKRPAWCYYNNDSTSSDLYGKLYNYHAVTSMSGLAPDGWSIPSTDEWQKLASQFGTEAQQGLAMKDTAGWCNGGNGSNMYGFAAMPGGRRSSDGQFDSASCEGYWWTSSPIASGDTASCISLSSDTSVVKYTTGDFGSGLSVRCVATDVSSVHEDEYASLGNPYPNPTNGDVVYIDMRDPLDISAGIQLVDAVGKMTSHRYRIDGTRLSLDLHDIPAGSYRILIRTSSGSYAPAFVRF